MVDYGQDPKYIYYIESRVDEPMTLAGLIKLQNIPLVLILSLLVGALMGDLLMGFSAMFMGMIYFNRALQAEKRGAPYTHHPFVVKHTMMLPKVVRYGLAPSLCGVRSFESEYRR